MTYRQRNRLWRVTCTSNDTCYECSEDIDKGQEVSYFKGKTFCGSCLRLFNTAANITILVDNINAENTHISALSLQEQGEVHHD